MNELLDTIKSLFTRKYTSIVHLALGLLIAFGFVYFPSLAITLFVLFALVEIWQSIVYWYFGPGKELTMKWTFSIAHYNDNGVTDFWESLVGVAFGLFLITVLRAFGVL